MLDVIGDPASSFEAKRLLADWVVGVSGCQRTVLGLVMTERADSDRCRP